MTIKPLTTLIISAVIIIGGATSYAFVKNNNDIKAAHAIEMQHAADMKKDKAADSQLSPADAASEQAHETNAMVKGSYTDYAPSKLANAEKGKVVLFFNASWCPTCKEANKNFDASTPPEGLTLLKVDYDNSKDLKKKYGVTYQHTYVQVDKDGNLVKKWSGSTSYNQLETQLN